MQQIQKASAWEEIRHDPIYYVHSAIGVLIMFGVGFLPPIPGITAIGMKVLGAFLGMLYGWIFIGFIWPSLLGIIALGLSGYQSVTEAFAVGLSNSTTMQILMTFIFFQYVENSGLSSYLAGWFVSRKINEGRPWTLVFIFLLGGTVLSAFINPFAIIILLWSMMGSLCQELGYKRGDKFTGFIMCGVMFLCTLSIFMFPFLPFPIIFLGVLGAAVDFGAVPMIGWCITGMVMELSLVGGYVLIGKYLLRVDVSRLKNIDRQFYEELRSRRMTGEEKIALTYLALFVAILVLPSFLPKAWALTAILNNLSILGAAILCLSGLCFRRSAREAVVNFGELVYRGVNWELIILFIATFAITPAMQSPQTGILNTVIAALHPLFNNLSPLVFLIAVLVVFGIATQFIHNIILLMVFLPTFGQLCLGLGIHPALFALMFATMLQAAFATPGASAQAAMMFGNTEWITSKDGYFYGSLFMLWALAVLLLIVYPLGSLLF